MTGVLSIRGAKEHNLKNVSLDIPKKTLTVITGVSGSGKSSLAFDTIYAEGQRRYVESLSAYARQFLNLSRKPNVDHIDGLSPAIAIEQKTTSKNPRSTVGTVTEIYDYLRLLYANVGVAHCPTHNIPIQGQTVGQMVDTLLQLPANSKIAIYAPVVRTRKGEYKKDVLGYQKQGFTRVRVNGKVMEITEFPALDKQKKHSIDVLVDRLSAKPDNRQRINDSLETALKLTQGLVVVDVLEGQENKPSRTFQFSERHSCPECGHSYETEPRLFSFNSPYGACKACDGLGEMQYFSPDLIIPNPKLSIKQGAVAPWGQTGREYYGAALSKHYNFSLDTPFEKLPEKVQNVIINGSGREQIKFAFEGGRARYTTTKTFDGLLVNLQKRWEQAGNPLDREDLNKFRAAKPCPECKGQRLNPNARAVLVENMNIAAFCDLSVQDAITTTARFKKMLSGNRATIATPILQEISTRLGFLQHVGLEYLTLARAAGTLSGGESQRIRLASQVGSGLTGVLYVLDEPSIGLHPRDNERLLQSLTRLRDLDNTVIVVEHDEEAIRAADFVVDMGPGAGRLGGEIVAQGTAKQLEKNEKSLTGKYLSGAKSIAVPAKRRAVNNKNVITLAGCTANNLKNITAHFPLGVMTCVTGVSGGGKSTLVMDTLHNAAAHRLYGSRETVGAYGKLTGLENIDKVVNIDQSPIGRTPRSNPATYTGMFGPIRDWFATLPEAKARGYEAGRFSFNVKGGRCEACEGDGLVRIEMHFLPDVYVPCDVCAGRRYNPDTLEITYKGKSIADVLEMTVTDCHTLFEAVPSIRSKLQTLLDVGLGYISLGQSATTLSGGEAQRIKLAKELSKRSTGRTLYILDEPTTGLHFADIEKLLTVLHRLVDEGNTMVIIEHNLDVIKTADHLIDIGPEGGIKGGTIVGSGTPEALAAIKTSYTGQFLKPLLAKKSKKAA